MTDSSIGNLTGHKPRFQGSNSPHTQTRTSQIAMGKTYFRRSGLTPNSNQINGTLVQLRSRVEGKQLWQNVLSNIKKITEGETGEYNTIMRNPKVTEVIHRNRTRRWDYDANYEWENGGKDYVVPGREPKKETKFEKFAKNWQKHALIVIFIFSVAAMLCCCCLACCKHTCSKLCGAVCLHCREWRDLALNRDPTFRRARQFADDYGIELDYSQYKEIKSSYESALKKQGYSKVDLSGR